MKYLLLTVPETRVRSRPGRRLVVRDDYCC